MPDRLCTGCFSCSFTYGYVYNSGKTYLYVTNSQRDVVRIVHSFGTAIIQCTYDAWGNILSTSGSLANTLGKSNPLRYRGYVYDTETGLYYLQTRYYDSQMGRFINADAYTSTGQGILGNNMFAYCNNTPILYWDHSGNRPSLNKATTYIQFDGGSNPLLDAYVKMRDSFKKNGVTLHHGIEGALSQWRSKYLPLSKACEHVTFLYSIDTPLGIRYYTSQTIKGNSGNVIAGTLLLCLQDVFYSGVELIAHVHTHPEVPKGVHNDCPSYDGGDGFVINYMGFPEMYVIPYSRCKDTPWYITYTDEATWCPSYPK